MSFGRWLGIFVAIAGLFFCSPLAGQELEKKGIDVTKVFKPLTEPPCTYCIEQHEKGLINGNDPVLAWTRAAHNGGAFPLRYFINKYRVINDTYGLFFYDPINDFVAAYEKDYGYQYIGRKDGEMLIQSDDGTIWSAIKGVGLTGPQKGHKLIRIPNIRTTWGHWLLLHPESTTYNLFDGNKYESVNVDESEKPKKNSVIVLGIDGQKKFHWNPEVDQKRFCQTILVGDQRMCFFWYGPTRTAVVYEAQVHGKSLTFYADDISPLTAPFKDKETGTRWTLAGRAIDGPLRGTDLKWVPSIQCNKSAWIKAFPGSQQIQLVQTE